MTDVEGLADVGGGVLHADVLARPQVAVAVFFLLVHDFLDYVVDHLGSGDEHVDVSAYLLDLLKERIVLDFGHDLFGDEVRGFSQGLCQAEAGQRIVAQLGVLRDLQVLHKFVIGETNVRCLQDVGNVLFEIDHVLLLMLQTSVITCCIHPLTASRSFSV